ncbi:lamin tail domain-containing protein [Aliagarivorans taiwanensis]|uniref:lamin tail domain-containing protein n=1 Tax=Aliagarivorans taiwanensis TaxID=561966 RepID=UPI00041E3DA1|nr:hypothetical protein [Aliagarivorans taiwanensis]
MKLIPWLLAASAASSPLHADVLFSEYVEGSSFNKALEIANYGDSSVDLSGYEVRLFSNGANPRAKRLAGRR